MNNKFFFKKTTGVILFFNSICHGYFASYFTDFNYIFCRPHFIPSINDTSGQGLFTLPGSDVYGEIIYFIIFKFDFIIFAKKVKSIIMIITMNCLCLYMEFKLRPLIQRNIGWRGPLHSSQSAMGFISPFMIVLWYTKKPIIKILTYRVYWFAGYRH